MSTTTVNNQEEWIKVLGKGMVTLPKKVFALHIVSPKELLEKIVS